MVNLGADIPWHLADRFSRTKCYEPGRGWDRLFRVVGTNSSSFAFVVYPERLTELAGPGKQHLKTLARGGGGIGGWQGDQGILNPSRWELENMLAAPAIIRVVIVLDSEYSAG